jgi:hypothetical protein
LRLMVGSTPVTAFALALQGRGEMLDQSELEGTVLLAF